MPLWSFLDTFIHLLAHSGTLPILDIFLDLANLFADLMHSALMLVEVIAFGHV